VPQLRRFYEEVNLEEKRIEVIYVGLDRVKKDYEAFVRTMPWLGIPFADERAPALKEFYDIRAVPKLLLLDSRGEEVRNNCREDVYALKEDEAFEKWAQLRAAQEKTYESR
jgi:nucleoredoxin